MPLPAKTTTFVCNLNVKLADNFNVEYISVNEFARKYGISERTARNYCATGKIEGVFLTGKTWNIPKAAGLPMRKSSPMEVMPLLAILREQKKMKLKGDRKSTV